MLIINAFGVGLVMLTLFGMNRSQITSNNESDDTSYIRLATEITPSLTIAHKTVSNVYDQENGMTKTTNQTITPELNQKNCPAFLFQCKAKQTKLSNSLYNQKSDVEQSKYICIDKSRLCDHVEDCPYGEDESIENCQQEHSGKFRDLLILKLLYIITIA